MPSYRYLVKFNKIFSRNY